MSESATPSATSSGSLRTNPWVVFLLPFVVYMIANAFEPSPPTPQAVVERVANEAPVAPADAAYQRYPAIYAAKIALTVAAIIFVWPGYRQFMPIRFGFLATFVGIVGAVLWIGLWAVDLESIIGVRALLGGAGQRSAFNPFARLATPAQAWAFMSLRLIGLALVVPLIEEMFLRGFVTRFAVDQNWTQVPIGKVTPIAVAAAIVVPVLMHPAELFAAIAWFGLMVWLYAKTKNIWDCVVAHITTNGLLGLYVLTSANPEAWQLL